MADYSTDLKSWGDEGEEFPNGYSYVAGEQPIDAWDNFVNRNTIEDIQHLIELTNKRLESTKGYTAPENPEVGEFFWNAGDARLSIYDEDASLWRDLAFSEELQAHEDDATNPHEVTADQLDAVKRGGDTMAGVLDLNENDLVDTSTTIWDAVAGHVPAASVEQGPGSGLDADTVHGIPPNELGPFKYVQEEPPIAETEIGSTWLKPSNGVVSIYTSYGWEPDVEVGYDETSDLSLSGWSVEHEKPVPRTELSDEGFLKLIDEVSISEFESFEIQNIETWTESDTSNTENITLQDDVVLNETKSYALSATNEVSVVEFEDSVTTRDFDFYINAGIDTGVTGDGIEFQFVGENEPILGRLVFHDAGEVEWQSEYSEPDPNNETYLAPVDETVMASWNAGVNYNVRFEFTFAEPTVETFTYDDGEGGTYDTTYEFSNDKVEIFINETSYGPFELPIDVGYTEASVTNRTTASGLSRVLYYDASFLKELAVIDNSEWEWDSTSDEYSVTFYPNESISGTRSPSLYSDTEAVSARMVRNNGIVQNLNITAKIENDTGSIFDYTAFDVEDNLGNSLGELKFNDGFGNVEWHEPNGTVTEVQSSWTAGINIDLKFDFDFSVNEITIVIDGNSAGTFSIPPADFFGAFTITNVTTGSNTSRNVFFDNLSEDPREFGNAVVVFPEPFDNIRDWDVLKYEYDLAGESITIDVEDENGNVLIEDISHFGDLSTLVDSEIDFRIRVYFSRNNVINNPMLTYLNRSWSRRPGDINALNLFGDSQKEGHSLVADEYGGVEWELINAGRNAIETDIIF